MSNITRIGDLPVRAPEAGRIRMGEKTEKGADLRIGNGVSDTINGTGLVIGQAFRW